MIVGVGVDVLVDVGEGRVVAKIIGVGVSDGPIVGVSVAARTVGVRVSVNVGDGSRVDVEVGVCVNVPVNVGDAPTVGETVAVTADVDVFVAVKVAVDVRVDVGVKVDVCVKVEVAVAVVITNCAGAPPSRDENSAPSVLSAIKANVYVPFPVRSEVTSYSTQVLVVSKPLLSDGPLNSAGLVFHVIADSVQELFAR